MEDYVSIIMGRGGLAYPLTQISMEIGSLIGDVNYLSVVITVVFMIAGLLCSNVLTRAMGG